jgi:pimeloyl-ACP methyl ester carboxylesterase
VDDLVGLIGGRRAVLVGHSFGSHVALSTAARCPDTVAGVAVYEAPVMWESGWPSDTAASQALLATDPADAVDRFMARMLGEERWKALPEGTREGRRAEGATLLGELAALRQGRPWDPGRIVCPLVLSASEPCNAVQRLGKRYMTETFPAATFVPLPGSGHAAPRTHPEQFASLIVGRVVDLVGEPWSTGAARPDPDSARA